MTEEVNCPCKMSRIRAYIAEDECLGFVCLSCRREWLPERFLYRLGKWLLDTTTTNSFVRQSFVIHQGQMYYSPPRKELSESKLLQVTASRDEIYPSQVEHVFRRGDHVAWHRPYLIWHHAIVENVKGTMLTVFHFSKTNHYYGPTCIKREVVDATKEWGTLYRITYNEDFCKQNPVELVIARAEALVGLEKFDLFSNNCDNFATFCRTGCNTPHQSKWLQNKLKEIVISICLNAPLTAFTTHLKFRNGGMLKVSTEEMKLVTMSVEAIRAAIIIAFEGGICIWNLGELHQKYKTALKDGSKSLSRRDFIKEMVDQITQRFFAAALGVGMGKALTPLRKVIYPSMGLAGETSLAIIECCAGSALGHALGVTLGQLISHVVKKTMTMNDRAVTHDALNPGDHVIKHGSLIHPRCHAILFQNNKEWRQIVVIRHSYKKGILLDTVSFSGCDPLFKVTYPESRPTYSSNEILKRAIKAVAENNTNKPNYNLLWNNCKHFVYSITLKKE